MLTAILAENQSKIIASAASKPDGPFVCPQCADEVILRKGMIKIPHFAHKPLANCEFGTGESEAHRQCKTEIYDALLDLDYLKCEIEKPLGKVRPDIYVESKQSGKKYAIEVQLSSLSLERIIARTLEYYRLGIYVLWLPQLSYSLWRPRYSPSAWEKWLHSLYFGKVYYWDGGRSILPVHFDKHMLYVESSEWHENGQPQSAGGYERHSKRYRTPRRGKSILFPDSFQGVERREWSGKGISVPRCRIVTERKTSDQ